MGDEKPFGMRNPTTNHKIKNFKSTYYTYYEWRKQIPKFNILNVKSKRWTPQIKTVRMMWSILHRVDYQLNEMAFRIKVKEIEYTNFKIPSFKSKIQGKFQKKVSKEKRTKIQVPNSKSTNWKAQTENDVEQREHLTSQRGSSIDR